MSTLEKAFNQALPAIAKIHDAAIKVAGQDVVVVIPDAENLDIYGVRTADATDEYITQMVIDWSSYRMMISTVVSNIGLETDDIPLLATAKVNDRIPTGSIIKVDVQLPDYQVEHLQFKVAKNDVVATTRAYGRQLTLIPMRGDNY